MASLTTQIAWNCFVKEKKRKLLGNKIQGVLYFNQGMMHATKSSSLSPCLQSTLRAFRFLLALFHMALGCVLFCVVFFFWKKNQSSFSRVFFNKDAFSCSSGLLSSVSALRDPMRSSLLSAFRLSHCLDSTWRWGRRRKLSLCITHFYPGNNSLIFKRMLEPFSKNHKRS